MIETCKYCETKYEVPEGKIALVESTCDREPPAQVCAWLSEPGERLPREFTRAHVLHYCERGKPVDPDTKWRE